MVKNNQENKMKVFPFIVAAAFVAGAGVFDVSRADGILANTAAPTVCITTE